MLRDRSHRKRIAKYGIESRRQRFAWGEEAGDLDFERGLKQSRQQAQASATADQSWQSIHHHTEPAS